MSAKLVLRRLKYTSNTQNLKELHWLPIHDRIDFKIISIVHRCIYGVAPRYLKEMLHFKEHSARLLRSNSDNLSLIIPRTKLKTFKARSFSASGPTLWNALPYELRQIENYQAFKKLLKNHLFTKRFVLMDD